MSLLERVEKDIVAAMRAKEAPRLGALRMLKTALVNRAIERGRALEDAEAQQVVSNLVKQRRESIDQFGRAGRQDLVDKEAAEIVVLEAYLPPAIDVAEVERLIDQAIQETGAAGAKDLGKVMKALMPKLAGRNADGKAVNEMVRRKLG